MFGRRNLSARARRPRSPQFALEFFLSLENCLSPIIPTHPSQSPVSLMFPTLTQNPGGGGYFHSSPVRSFATCCYSNNLRYMPQNKVQSMVTNALRQRSQHVGAPTKFVPPPLLLVWSISSRLPPRATVPRCLGSFYYIPR
jgi:hypothetical protein